MNILAIQRHMERLRRPKKQRGCYLRNIEERVITVVNGVEMINWMTILTN